jgi:ornithine cyclodeaminase
MTQVMALKEGVPSLEICKVYDLNVETSKRFVEKMKDKVDLKFIIVSSAREVFEGSDVISTATMAKKPYVDASWYKEGAFHCEISFWDTPPEALKVMDFVVVDDWYQVSHHGVDVSYRAVRDGHITEDKIRGNLGEIITGNKQGRTNAKERIFFNPIGMGIHDLSEAYRVYENALAMGIGKKLPLWESPILE